MRRLLVLLATLIALLAAPPALAQPYELPPRPDGPIYDGADMLSPATEAELDQRLRDYNAGTGQAIIVATVPSLDGEVIEPYATALYGEWGIGGEQRDTGLLLLIARDDRKMRIEVGYGLHPYFGGIMAGRVIGDTITPRFKEGNFDAGVSDGVDAILAHLANSPQDAIAIEEAAAAAAAQERENGGGFPVGALIWGGVIFFFFVLPALRGGGRGKRRFRRSGPWGDAARDIILWEAGKAIVRGLSDGDDWGGGGGFGGGGFGGGDFGGGGGGFGGFGGGMSGGGGASGGW